MAGYAFTALNLAADKIPDKVWHNIPGGYFCPPEVKEEKEREKAEERGENVDDKARSRKSDNRERRSPDKERPRKLPSDSEDSDRSRDSKSRRNRDKDRNRSRRDGRDDRDRDRNRDRKEERDGDRKRRDDKPQRRPQAQRSRGSGYLDRGYESDSGPKPKPSKLRESDYYFPPPPTEAVNHYVDPRSGEHVYQPTAPYHPSQFDASPGYRDNYYSGHPEEQDPYTPAEHEPDHEGDSEREDDIKSGQRNVKGLIEDSPERTRSSARQASSRSGQKYTPGPTNPYSPPPSQNGYAMPPYTAPQNPYAQQSAPGYVHPAYVAPVAAGVPYAPSPQAYGAGPPPGAYPPQHGYQYGYSPPQGYMPPPNAAAAQAMPYRQRYPSPYDSDGYPIGDEKREAKLREQSKRAKSASRGRSRAKSKSQKEKSDDDDESGSGSDDDKKEGSRGPPQNRQRSTSRLREQIQTYGKRHVDLGTAALGALAGGFIGRNVGKGGEWGTILGAAIGGLGGAYGEKAIEKRRNHQKEKERKHEYHRGRRHGHREEQGRSHSRRGRSRSKVGGYDKKAVVLSNPPYPQTLTTSRYASTFTHSQGPDDSRPTALQIIKDESLINKLTGRIALITGATSGIGLETARALHAAGMTIYIGARSQKKGQSAIDSIQESNKDFSKASLSVLEMDLSSLDSVRKAASTFLSNTDKLHVLVCNAGIMAPPYETTTDGFESQFGICHLGHFLLFQLLKPTLLSSSTPDHASRVVTVSSFGHRGGEINFNSYDYSKGKEYNPWSAYGQAKTASIYMSNEIDRRYGSSSSTKHPIHALSIHPGFIKATNLHIHVDDESAKMFDSPEHKLYMKSPEQGAATSVFAAVSKEWEGRGGVYMADCTEQGVIKSMENPVTIEDEGYAPWAMDEEKAGRLWGESCGMVGVEDD